MSAPPARPAARRLMSGRHEFKNGVTHTILERERMSLKTFTLAQMLKSVGYTTGIFGKWHLGDEEAYRPESRGFDEVYIHGGGGIGQTYPGSCGDAPGNTNIDPGALAQRQVREDQGLLHRLVLRPGDQVDGRRALRQAALLRLHPAQRRARPARRAGGILQAVSRQARRQRGNGEVLRHDREHRHEFRQAARESSRNGASRTTRWSSTSPATTAARRARRSSTRGLHGGKGTPYQGGTRAAAFFRWPGGEIPGRRRVRCPERAHRIFPTLAELTGAKLSDEVKSRSKAAACCRC